MSSGPIFRSITVVGAVSIGAFAVLLTLVSSAGMSLPVYLLASSIVLLDGIDVIARLWLRGGSIRQAQASKTPVGKTAPFAILVSIHNLEDELDLLFESLKAYRSNVWIIDDASTDGTVARLRASGWRYIEASRNRKKPGAIFELLQQLPPEIGTILVMDPDICLPDNLPERIHAFQQSDADALCPKITVREDGSLAELQHIEYTLSFDLGRHSLSPMTVTSGVALYRRRALDEAMTAHSLSVYGEDLENAVVILSRGGKIVYDPSLIIETEGKPDLKGWFSQRVGWSFSLLKIYGDHFAEVRRIMTRSALGFYQFGVYFFIFSIVFWPLKIVSIVLLAYSALNGLDELFAFGVIADNALNHPGFFAASYLKYTTIILAAFLWIAPAGALRRGLKFMPFFFPYCIALVVPTCVGYLNWIGLRLFGRRVYDDHYDENPQLGLEQRHV